MSSLTSTLFLGGHIPTTSTTQYDYDTPFERSYNTTIPRQPLSEPHWTAAAYNQALALLQQCTPLRGDIESRASNPSGNTTSTFHPSLKTNDLPLYDLSSVATSTITARTSPDQDWSMYQAQYNSGMGGWTTPTQQQQTQGLTRSRSHQRTPSASTVGSNGPASPYSYNTSYPQISTTDYTDSSPASYNPWDITAQLSANAAPSFTFSKSPYQANDFYLNSPGYLPSAAAHTPAAHLAMKGFAIDHHNAEDMASERYPNSSRQSASSVGQDSPATPRSNAEDSENKPFKVPSNGEIIRYDDEMRDGCLLSYATEYRAPNPEVSLQRAESAAYQDELYNPANFASMPSSAPRPANNLLTPHRNLVSERLQTANIARSTSPSSAVSRERSPFRQGSPLAPPVDGWNSPRPGVGTQAGMRQQQKEQMEEAEYAQHMPALKREPTKTISPKDALLDYTDTDQAPLFQDTVPEGYKQHDGGTESYPQNFFSSVNAGYVGGLPTTTAQNMAGFRATDGLPGGNFGFTPHDAQAQGQAAFQSSGYQQAPSYTATSMAEQTPDFPAHLTSMESSISENAAAPSSQESINKLAVPQRPTDTRAGTGTYTCTYHGCTQRFESQPALQRHKRDFHRSQAHAHKDSGVSSSAASASAESHSDSISPRDTESPDQSGGGGLTSAALLARNSQAGPHKCTRENPSTGKPCNTIFSRPYDLTRHEDTIHNGAKRKVRCEYCREEKTFSRNDALTRHMRVVHPEVAEFGKRGRRD